MAPDEFVSDLSDDDGMVDEGLVGIEELLATNDNQLGYEDRMRKHEILRNRKRAEQMRKDDLEREKVTCWVLLFVAHPGKEPINLGESAAGVSRSIGPFGFYEVNAAELGVLKGLSRHRAQVVELPAGVKPKDIVTVTIADGIKAAKKDAAAADKAAEEARKSEERALAARIAAEKASPAVHHDEEPAAIEDNEE